MFTCKDCPFWTVDPHDCGVGNCTGLVSSGRIQFNAGAYGAEMLEVYTPHDHYCEIGVSASEAGAKA